MKDVSIEKLQQMLKLNTENVKKVKKSYQYAKELHSNQVRQSGEPYIIHPLNVAYILAEMNADVGNTMVGAFVNDEYVQIDYSLKNKDRVRIVTDNLSFGPREDWLEKAQTSHARKK